MDLTHLLNLFQPTPPTATSWSPIARRSLLDVLLLPNPPTPTPAATTDDNKIPRPCALRHCAPAALSPEGLVRGYLEEESAAVAMASVVVLAVLFCLFAVAVLLERARRRWWWVGRERLGRDVDGAWQVATSEARALL
ncbi:hypothetical protein EJ03DRAFT_90150 [Teratosphaeria nubilosa]|uniref:Uncharacterized protein n=1 Tax=Teratosphaeria nubilosa TaxID=161662 RepID=A0A6G1LBL8_9PEZI|nr:hypothetical protein EJ03DRAFT_90150 [Teratosphaeria nubilosa]